MLYCQVRGGTAVLYCRVVLPGEETELRARGRHDPCVVPRAVPMVESMVALVLADQLLQVRLEYRPWQGSRSGSGYKHTS